MLSINGFVLSIGLLRRAHNGAKLRLSFGFGLLALSL